MIFSYLLNMQSHPSWVCGLKLYSRRLHMLPLSVTPFVGVWIETLSGMYKSETSLVTPFVGVWIETAKAADMRAAGLVTPFVGVWIETIQQTFAHAATVVTPFVGVWIETINVSVCFCVRASHPSWVCGLKLYW